MWQLLKRLAKNDNKAEISFMDVKELYDAAYEEKAQARVNLKRFEALITKAIRLDEAYRTQLELSQHIKYRRVA